MADWFIRAFGAAVADVEAKIISEGWFGRRVPEPSQGHDLGWLQDSHHQREQPEHANEHEHGIDR